MSNNPFPGHPESGAGRPRLDSFDSLLSMLATKDDAGGTDGGDTQAMTASNNVPNPFINALSAGYSAATSSSFPGASTSSMTSSMTGSSSSSSSGHTATSSTESSVPEEGVFDYTLGGWLGVLSNLEEDPGEDAPCDPTKQPPIRFADQEPSGAVVPSTVGSKTPSTDSPPPEVDTTANPAKKRRKKDLTEEERRLRNFREQARSNQLSYQIEEVRSILTAGGVIVPRATKGAVLSAAIAHMQKLQEQLDQVNRYGHCSGAFHRGCKT